MALDTAFATNRAVPSGAMQERHDIATRADIELLVDRFYETAMVDPLIGFLFTDVAHLDLEKHRPTITAFWETLLLGAGTYGGGAFAVHARLHDAIANCAGRTVDSDGKVTVLKEKVPLQAGHFTRWVVLWENTVNELFAGEVADAAINHGRRIATAFFRRLQDPTYGFAADELPVLPITQVPGAAL